MSKPESGRWEQSLRRLAFDLHRCTEEEIYLRASERLVPLFTAADNTIRGVDFGIVDLTKEMESWKKKI